MKFLSLYIILFLLNISTVFAQYPYSEGNLVVSGITYKCSSVSPYFSIENILNSLSNTTITHPNIDCGEAHFKKPEWTKIEGVFKQVFSPQRRVLFDNRKSIDLYIYADAAGKIKEVGFRFHNTCPVTPQELYNLEVGLKALPPLQYAYPADCSGVNYRVTNSAIYIHKL